MPKKRKLNSKNPIYSKVDDNAPKIKKKVLMYLTMMQEKLFMACRTVNGRICTRKKQQKNS